jgi:hypothetical protein
MIFALDTGATRSNLFPPFFRTFEEEIKSQYPMQRESIRGAGGSKEVSAYQIKDLSIEFAGKRGHFSDVLVLTEPVLNNSRYLYGNLGRDLITQFERMTINFERPSVVFD